MTASALILIDIQQGFDDPVWGTRNHPHAEDRAAGLLTLWRAQGWPIVHIQHLSVQPGSPLETGSAGTAFKPQVAPQAGEVIFTKHVNSAFIGTGLERHLQDRHIRDVVICGLTTPHCVSTTTRMAANLGFTVRVAEDATAAFSSNADFSFMPDHREGVDPEIIHRMALSHLHSEFAQVTSTAQIIESSLCG